MRSPRFARRRSCGPTGPTRSSVSCATFIYGLEDIDRGADALRQAQRLGFSAGRRETTQLADGYRTRGETLMRTARTLEGMPQEAEYLQRAAESLREALTLYGRVPGSDGVAMSLRRTQLALERSSCVFPRSRIRWRSAQTKVTTVSRRPPHPRLRGATSRPDRRARRSVAGMAVTYTRAAQRDRQVTERALRRPGVGELVLVAVSLVSIGVMLAAYMGRMALTRRLAVEGPSVVVNLNTVAGAPELEPALAFAFEHEADRKLAARELFAFIAQG